MKRRLISAALIFALVLVLPGMGTRANPGDSGNEEEAEEDFIMVVSRKLISME